MDKKTELKNRLIKEFLSTYRSSDLYNEVNFAVNELMIFLSHLMNEKEDVVLFFKYLPDIIIETPHQSEVTPLGYEHFYDIRIHKEAAEKAATMREFLKPFMFDKKRDNCDGLKHFCEYNPVMENAPPHSNEHADYRAVLPYRNNDQLETLCRKIGIDYKKLIKEVCFAADLNGIPVFVSYSSDRMKKTGNLELHISDPDDPYTVTEKLRRVVKEADKILNNAFNKKNKRGVSMKKIFILIFIFGVSAFLSADSLKLTPGFYTYIQTIMGNVSLYVELKPDGKCEVYSASTEEIFDSADKIPYKKGTCSYDVKKNILTFKTHVSPKTHKCSFTFVEGGEDEKTGVKSGLDCKGWRDNLVFNKDFVPGVKNN